MSRVWGLLGHRRGDNQQVEAFTARLGASVTLKQLHFGPESRTRNIRRRANPLGITVDATTPIAPPWPDMVVAVGYRSAPMALAIREAAGGRPKLVQLGRPRAPHAWFDLIVTTPQYRLGATPNVVTIPLPFGHAVAGTDPVDAAGPRLTVLVGGPTKELVFDVAEAHALGALVDELVGAHGGTALVTTSPRTPPAVVEALRTRLTVPHVLHAWSAGAANPYAAFLASADALLVTGDSVSMLADACRTGAPVRAFALPERFDRRRRAVARFCAFAAGLAPRRDPISRALFAIVDGGLLVPQRAYGDVHRALAARGLLDDLTSPPARSRAERIAEIAAWETSAVDRARALLGDEAARRAAS